MLAPSYYTLAIKRERLRAKRAAKQRSTQRSRGRLDNQKSVRQVTHGWRYFGLALDSQHIPRLETTARKKAKMSNNKNNCRELTTGCRELNDNELDAVVGGSPAPGPQPPVTVWHFREGIPLKYATPALS
jgi:hypothetical protein